MENAGKTHDLQAGSGPTRATCSAHHGPPHRETNAASRTTTCTACLPPQPYYESAILVPSSEKIPGSLHQGETGMATWITFRSAGSIDSANESPPERRFSAYLVNAV